MTDAEHSPTPCLTIHPISVFFILLWHYTLFIHWKTHSFEVSLYSIKSSVVHSWGSIVHFSKWSMVCVCSPQLHMVSASLYFHFSMFGLQRPIPVLSLFKHFQCNHGASDPVLKSSDGMDLSLCGRDRMWWVHALCRSAGGIISSGVTECTKLFLDFRRLFIGSWLYMECLGSSVCSLLSCRDVVALLTQGGALPARRYTLSTDIGLRHPVMERHALFRAGSSLLTCFDLSHTGHAYSTVE